MDVKILFLSLLPLLVSAASSTVDIGQFTDRTVDSKDLKIITESFDAKPVKWRMSKHFQWSRGTGVNGSGGLCAQRENAEEHLYAVKNFKLRHGVLYRFSCSYRSDMKKSSQRWQEYFCVRFTKNGKYNGGAFHVFHEPGSRAEWSTQSTVFSLPEDCDETVVVNLLMRIKRTGKIWYDNITIEPLSARNFYCFPLRPFMQNIDKTGKLTLKVVLPEKSAESDYVVCVKTGGICKVFPIKQGIAEGMLGTLPDGKNTITTEILDLKKKEIVFRRQHTLYYRKQTANPGKVTIADNGRIFRNGKPYLPIGIFMGYYKKGDTDFFKRVADAGFNSVQGVPFALLYHGKKGTVLESIKASMREMAKHDLTYLCAIKYQIPQRKEKVEQIDHVKGMNNVTEYVITGLKNEPNLLGYYVSDENPLDQIPAIKYLRDLAGRLDSDHLTMTLTATPEHMIDFAQTGDFLMVDVYPVGERHGQDGEAQCMTKCRKHLETAIKTGLPVVWVPQIFAWSSFREDLPVRYPTLQEIRSMVLLGAIYDVKAYYFYAYHPIFYYSEERDPGHSQEQWAKVVPVARMLKKLTPFLLSNEKPSALEVKHISGPAVMAKTFSYNKNHIVVITADGPGTSVAEIHALPGLKSKFGKTVEKAPGVYVFTGKHIDSDVLYLSDVW